MMGDEPFVRNVILGGIRWCGDTAQATAAQRKSTRTADSQGTGAEARRALDNALFYMAKTMMVFGDVKKVVEEMVRLRLG